MVKSDASHLSPSGRSSKRQKLTFFSKLWQLLPTRPAVIKDTATGTAVQQTAVNHSVTTKDAPTLVPEIWAHVCDFLPYDSLLQTAAVSRDMLTQVMPRVTMLHIDTSYQLHVGVCHRYRDVKDIYIYSLIKFGVDEFGDNEWEFDVDTIPCLVPFLCKFTSCLERVFLGGKQSRNGQVTVAGFIPEYFISSGDGQRMKNLIDAISGAYKTGALGNNVWIAGLRCPRSRYRIYSSHGCEVCQRACNSFPLKSVIDFDSGGSRISRRLSSAFASDLYDEDIFGLNVCLDRAEIERIIVSRPGGKELLYSKTWFMTLLGRADRNIVVTKDDKILYVAKYDDEVLKQISQFIEDTSIDVTSLRPYEVVEAIRRSFAADERDPLPPKEQCYLAGGSFKALKELGLPVVESDFQNEDEPYTPFFWRFY